jgi:phage shock protein A
MQEELERKLTEQTASAAQQENTLKTQVTELENEIAELKVQISLICRTMF